MHSWNNPNTEFIGHLRPREELVTGGFTPGNKARKEFGYTRSDVRDSLFPHLVMLLHNVS